MSEFNLTKSSARLVLSCLEDHNTTLLRQIDNFRKMKGSIEDDLYKTINTRYQEELELVQQTIWSIEDGL